MALVYFDFRNFLLDRTLSICESISIAKQRHGDTMTPIIIINGAVSRALERHAREVITLDPSQYHDNTDDTPAGGAPALPAGMVL